jgi:hypothetical protein
MKFRNRRNGIVLNNMPDTFSGKNWEPVIEEPAPVTEEKPKTKKSSVKKNGQKVR